MATKVIAHRGSAFLNVENSTRAFESSIQLGVDFIECDIHSSVDNELFVLHDATLERTTEGFGPVRLQPAEYLDRLRLRGAGGDRIPKLSEVVALLAPTGTGLQIEIKTDNSGQPYPGILERTLRCLDAANRRSRCGIIAFHAPTAAAAEAAGGLDHVAWLFGPSMLRELGAAGVVGVAKAHGLRAVETHVDALDAELTRVLRDAGLRIAVWGANHADSAARMLALGVDMMASDDAATALRVRAEADR
ncbi:glycerophosphodiester phosphodiesterase [Roseomonas elaeocarpi]|uniref:Glycerophosphodiester phosphodiesterase n=1 Tax=Roseomonas elaeocarpi TaxID=907779 RepID=A0ABV6JZ58_9PROT